MMASSARHAPKAPVTIRPPPNELGPRVAAAARDRRPPHQNRAPAGLCCQTRGSADGACPILAEPARLGPRSRDGLRIVHGDHGCADRHQLIDPDQGGLSASPDEISWVQTSYLIADVVMVPLSGTLSRLLSTRVLFVTATLGFTAASALCATATSLDQMILYRALQGFSGGAITPSVFPVVYSKFRGPQLATLMVLISLILNLSSTMGPTIGGFLTDTFSWHWLFLVNIVPGIAVAITVWWLIDIDKPDWSLLRYFDLYGLVLMALFLGCLQYALEEGPRWDWLADNTIRAAVVVSSVASALFFWRVLTYHQPIVDLRAFTNRNFAVGSF